MTALELDIHDLSDPLEPGTTLIEASAGTGKTYTIAAIFLRLIVEHGLNVEQILVTTFTIPATAELRERIRRKLRQAQRAFREERTDDPLSAALLEKYRDRAPEMAARLQAALLDFDQARISTIHGFCQRVLAECSFESGAAAETEFLEDESDLIQEVVRDFWREQFYQCEECLAAAARCAKLSLESLAGLLDLRLKKPLAKIIPAPDLKRLPALRSSLVKTVAELRDCWAAEEQQIALPFFEKNNWSNRPFNSPELMEVLWEGAASCLRADATSLAGYEHLLQFSNSTLAASVKARPATHKAPSHRFHDLCEQLCELGTEYKQLLETRFLEWAPPELARRKIRANVTAYSDLLGRLHGELKSARGPALVGRLRGQYRAALIDEFQDTDAVQEDIFQRIFAGAQGDEAALWLFLIGDPKQAIYGFRGADVFSYLDAASRAKRRRTLQTNHRSTQALVDGVNSLFEANEHAFVVDGIGYEHAKASGRNERPFSGDEIAAPLRIWAWRGDEATPADDLKAELGRATAAEIARLLADDRFLIGDERVRPADIAVLTAWNEEAAAMQEELRRVGVPSVVLSMASVFASREAMELLQLLAAMAQPTQERLVRGALLTDLLGVKATELHAMASDEARWETWLQRFHGWHALWVRRGFVGAFRRAMHDLKLRPRLISLENGERRLTNLVHLSELVQRAAGEEQLSPQATVEWLARRVSEAAASPRATDEDSELRLERDDEAVRIVTVHKSKGLQYPIVFCPFSWKAVAGKASGRATFHDEANQVVLDTGSDEVEANFERERWERLAEEVRLLYVAVTRAQYRCDLAVPFTKKSAESAMNWLLQHPPESVREDVSLLGEHFKTLPAETWLAHLQALAVAAPASVAVVEPPGGFAAKAPKKAKTKGGSLGKARDFRGQIQRDFCVSSFSSLTEGASPEVPEHYVPPAIEEPVLVPEQDDIHAFPAGTRAGLCLHEIFEEIDFADLSNLEALVITKLGHYSLDPARWKSAVAGCIQRVLATPLAGGQPLEGLTARERLAEREFHLPAGRLEARELRRILGAGDEPGGLEFLPRQGWLKGFIDLIYRRDGRYYLADWKSNRLGATTAAYTPEAVGSAMKAHHYGLQAHLYALALHRYLRQRQAGYDFEKHFGGMYYFFVRGLDEAHPEFGLWHERPSLETITRLEHWLEGRND